MCPEHAVGCHQPHPARDVGVLRVRVIGGVEVEVVVGKEAELEDEQEEATEGQHIGRHPAWA